MKPERNTVERRTPKGFNKKIAQRKKRERGMLRILLLNRITAAKVWLSPFFHWKKGCELIFDCNEDDSGNPAD